MSFSWPAASTNDYTLNLSAHIDSVGRWAAVRIYDTSTFASGYNELRKTSSGQVFAHTDYFKKIWIEPIGRVPAVDYVPHGRWTDKGWNCVIPLISPTASSPAGVIIKENDEIILPNYWDSSEPSTLIGLSIESQYKIEVPHLYQMGLNPGFWFVQFEQIVKK